MQFGVVEYFDKSFHRICLIPPAYVLKRHIVQRLDFDKRYTNRRCADVLAEMRADSPHPRGSSGIIFHYKGPTAFRRNA